MSDINKMLGQLLGSGAAGGFAGGLAGGLAGNLLFREIISKLSNIHKPSSCGKLDRQTACALL